MGSGQCAEASALAVQVGGGHYKTMPIQPVEFALVNGLNTCQANIVKYVCRHGSKGGAEDLKKAIHYCDLWRDISAAKGLPIIVYGVEQIGAWRPVDEFIGANQLPEEAAVVVRLICLLPSVARIKTARAGLVAMLMAHYGEVA